MHQRQASSYGRRFNYGAKQASQPIVESLWIEPGIGLIPAEFDDLQGSEAEIVEDLARVKR
jgi:hypothetical protein